MDQIREKNIKKSIDSYKFIAADNQELYENLIQKDPRVEVFWQNSKVSGEVLLWYPFNFSNKIVIFEDAYSNYSNVLKSKGLTVLDGLIDEIKIYSYKYAIFNLRPFPAQKNIILPIFIYKLENILKYICEAGILLILCTKSDADYIRDIVGNYGFIHSNLYDPLHIGLCVFELSKEEVSDKYDLLPTVAQARHLLSCAWTEKFGNPVFGEVLQCRDEDIDRIKDVTEIELDLLRKLKCICDKYNLQVYPMYGSLLGAARSAGVIDGDDDIDVALPRADFNKLVSIKYEFEDPYFLQIPAEEDCFYGGYLKLRNKNTTAFNPQNWWTECCEGIGIDIFPIDYGFADERKEKWKRFRIKQAQRFLYAKAYGYVGKFMDMKLLKWKGYKYIGKLFSREQLARWLDRELMSGEDTKKSPVGIYTHYGGVRYLDKKELQSKSLLKFEDMMFQVPGGWDMILRRFYGDSYMDVKPWNEYKTRHGFYDVDTSYLVYLDRFRGLHRTKSSDGKKIVLFGMEVLMNAYLKRYPDEKYRPEKIVSVRDEEYELLWELSNREEESGIMKPKPLFNCLNGIERVFVEYFSEKDLSGYYPVVCAVDCRRVGEMLQKIGFKEYYFYWENREWMLRANLSSIRKDLLSDVYQK